MATGDKYPLSLGATGEIDGTGSAIYIKLGFKPRVIKLFNIDDAGGQTTLEWVQGMGDGKGVKTVDSGLNTTNLSFITSNGITPGNSGFTIGTDGDVNVSAETIHWVAFR